MGKIKFILFIFFFIICQNVYAREVTSASWPKSSKPSYNECNFIFSFICTMTNDVKSDVNIAYINSYITIYNSKGDKVKKFKVKKIEYNRGNCWLTPQPIRGYTTYFVTNECIAR